MPATPSAVSDMLVTVKSRQIQRAMFAVRAGDREAARRHFLAAAHLELVLAHDYDLAGEPDLALRSRIVLRCAEGLDNDEVAEQLGINEKTVSKWRRRFVEPVVRVEGGRSRQRDRPVPDRPATARHPVHRGAANRSRSLQ